MLIILGELFPDLYIRKAKGGTRSATVIDSPYIPESKEYFMITEKGIEDAPSTD